MIALDQILGMTALKFENAVAMVVYLETKFDLDWIYSAEMQELENDDMSTYDESLDDVDDEEGKRFIMKVNFLVLNFGMFYLIKFFCSY